MHPVHRTFTLWWCLLVMGFLGGCTTDPANRIPIPAELLRAQRQAGFALHIPALPDTFSLTDVNVTESEPEPGMLGRMVTIAYQSEAGSITLTQYRLSPDVVPAEVQGPDIRPVQVADAVFPMREFTTDGVSFRHIYYTRGTLRLHITTNIESATLTDAELAALAESLQPLGR